ncbi:hypothetical protein WN944_027541 [Citrus x changshan-huyou]|uniref:Uncharacterized protein n=1 Tax=Citrus x changshan-huyou TaxID=2935761 RepID=A0AAP0Q9Z1_9ROSI
MVEYGGWKYEERTGGGGLNRALVVVRICVGCSVALEVVVASTVAVAKSSAASLCLTCIYRIQQQPCSIWVMKEYGVMESWTKLFSRSVERVCRPLACSKNGDEVLDHKSGESLYWYQEEGWGLDSSTFMARPKLVSEPRPEGKGRVNDKLLSHIAGKPKLLVTYKRWAVLTI